ncbi:phosphatase PAP2 family protein [Actinokineospora pegani]|uniref:phosphatase PAP2 family protein n=1 Tax=Actinokineospora pegani TaxID=2654637 RepID=UPI0012EA66DF|nr:phosphatase PAP2 family protein [Actinokineospora pegani]
MIRPLVAGFGLIAVFVVLGVLFSGPAPGFDVAVADVLGADHAGPVGAVAQVVSDVLGPVLPITAGVVGLVWAVVVRQSEPGLSVLLVKSLVVLVLCRLVSFVKPLFARDRPRAYPEFSYPSGHVVSVAAVAFTAAVLCAWLARSRLRACRAWGAAAVVAAALCRMLMDVHWLSDTIGAAVGVAGVGLVASAALGLLPPGSVPREERAGAAEA